MRIGVTVPLADGDLPGHPGPVPWPAIRAFAELAEGLGYDSVWVFDHVMFRLPGKPDQGIHEAWTVLTALAGVTTRVELGALVFCASFRNPALMAKMAATLDHVSGGRLILGLGAGWHDPEYEAFGYPADRKVDRFAEELPIITRLLAGERLSLEGRYHALRDAVLVPPPERRVPVLVAGRKPRMMDLVARHADAWNTAWFGIPDERLHDQLAALDGALEAVGRDPASIRRTVGMQVRDPQTTNPEDARSVAFAGSVEALAEAFDAYAALGIDDLVIWLVPKSPDLLGRVAEAAEIHRRRATGPS
jgi:probable F420-dependent oxidoreductase